MVAPKNLEDMGVRKRQYFMSWNNDTSENSKAYRDAVKFAIKNGLSESDVKRFRLKNTKGSEPTYGFYVPQILGELTNRSRCGFELSSK